MFRYPDPVFVELVRLENDIRMVTKYHFGLDLRFGFDEFHSPVGLFVAFDNLYSFHRDPRLTRFQPRTYPAGLSFKKAISSGSIK